MTTHNFQVRLSPSGPRIGDPPLTLGPGSIGRVWRLHGSSTAMVVPAGTAATAVTDFDAMPVNIKPGYLYDLGLDYIAQTSDAVTGNAQFTTYYALRNASTSAWGAWVPMFGGVHVVPNLTVNAGTHQFFGDASFAVSATVTCNAIRFGVIGDQNTGLTVLPSQSFARVAEYMP